MSDSTPPTWPQFSAILAGVAAIAAVIGRYLAGRGVNKARAESITVETAHELVDSIREELHRCTGLREDLEKTCAKLLKTVEEHADRIVMLERTLGVWKRRLERAKLSTEVNES